MFITSAEDSDTGDAFETFWKIPGRSGLPPSPLSKRKERRKSGGKKKNWDNGGGRRGETIFWPEEENRFKTVLGHKVFLMFATSIPGCD